MSIVKVCAMKNEIHRYHRSDPFAQTFVKEKKYLHLETITKLGLTLSGVLRQGFPHQFRYDDQFSLSVAS